MKNISELVKLYRAGTPLFTEAVEEKTLKNLKVNILEIKKENSKIEGFLNISKEDEQVRLTCDLLEDDMVIGLGETVHRMNKRGTVIKAFCSDDPAHLPHKSALYGAHNFFIIDGVKKTGIFIDYPGEITFDVGFSVHELIDILITGSDFDLYVIEGESLKEISGTFLKLIGKSYVPPKWAFGYQQCRWSYETADEIRRVAKGFRDNDIPCDAIYLDIDYMERFKDFTISDERFPNFEKLVSDMIDEGIRLIPIIDAGVKIEKDYDVYEEGVKNNYFCTDKGDKPFVAAVWPGLVHFPDFLNKDARRWFGLKYKVLTDFGIEGFWNDMNEPAVFYTPEGLKSFYDEVDAAKEKELDIYSYFDLMEKARGLANSMDDYKSFYHNVNGVKYQHDKVHNIYGYNMTKSAAEGLKEIDENKRFLLFSRASYIGMHRHGGIWTGDNHSWWEHILMAIRMMPSINMCGFIYSGCDTGGFQSDASSELITRWTQFSVFTPLLRNHAVLGSRSQEPFAYDKRTTDILRDVIDFRYALVPYLYSEYMSSVKEDKVLFSTLNFEYSSERVRSIDDQILCGDSLMLAPIYEKNSTGRYIHLPEDMLLWKVKNYKNIELSVVRSGDHFVDVPLDEIPMFIRKNKIFVLGNSAKNVEHINNEIIKVIGYVKDNATYTLYDDDGITNDYKDGAFSEIEISINNYENKLEIIVDNRGNEKIKILEFIIADDNGSIYKCSMETNSGKRVIYEKVKNNDN